MKTVNLSSLFPQKQQQRQQYQQWQQQQQCQQQFRKLDMRCSCLKMANLFTVELLREEAIKWAVMVISLITLKGSYWLPDTILLVYSPPPFSGCFLFPIGPMTLVRMFRSNVLFEYFILIFIEKKTIFGIHFVMTKYIKNLNLKLFWWKTNCQMSFYHFVY